MPALPPPPRETHTTGAPSEGRSESDRPWFDYERISPGYYDHVFHRSRGPQSKWHHLKFERIRDEISGHRRVLDIGCGPGTFIGTLSEDHVTVGVDTAGRQIAYANLRYGSPERSFHRCNMAELSQSLGEFDAVTAIELIEHLSPMEVKETLEAAVDRLAPGGKLVLTTPNFGGAWPIVERALNRFGDMDYELQHTNKFTRSSLAVLLTMLGLEDSSVGTYMGTAPFLAALGWRLSDVVAEFERQYFAPRMGLLLVGTGLKPA